MTCVLDASAALAWAFDDERDAAADALNVHVAETYAHVPLTWHLEIANGLWVGERRRRLSPGDMLDFVDRLAALDIRIQLDAVARGLHDVLQLARRHGVSPYDAAYLDLALRTRLPLATRDNELAAVAQRLGIALVPA